MKIYSVSDLHLGSYVFRDKSFLKFLDIIDKQDKLVLNGDIFDSINFKKLKNRHWKVYKKLRDMGDQVYWVVGNHEECINRISCLTGINWLPELLVEIGNKKFLFVHGDQFDDFIKKRPILTRLADFVYYLLQKIDRSQYLAVWAKHKSKEFANCKNQVKDKAVEYKKEINADVVVCGHTHFAEECGNYINTGCWTEIDHHYLELSDKLIQLKKFIK
jgi:UDP-2,3-diacylglucosamine pyrophosphatase LpxH